MSRLIDAEALLELFDKKCARECDNCVYYENCKGNQYCGLIDRAPTIETTTVYEFKGCDNCGARMED